MIVQCMLVMWQGSLTYNPQRRWEECGFGNISGLNQPKFIVGVENYFTSQPRF